ncbi:2-dehydropantoate 2-reductase [Bacillaceae bacterium]
MKILVLGAGAVGGYFGGRLAEKGEDVTFLVREGRRRQLAANGLVIRSVHGDFRTEVQTLVPGEDAPPFDLVLFAVKAYHLEEAIEGVAPYVGEKTTILPLLNGMAHLERLRARFGAKNVLGGLCFIESTLSENGEVVQTSQRHDLVFGELDGACSHRVEQIAAAFSGANCAAKVSSAIERQMWLKFIFITSMSGMTTLMDSPLGPILEREDGEKLYRQFVDELVAIARADGAPVTDDDAEKTMGVAKSLAYTMKSSMLRDMEKGLPVEADHLQGDFWQRAARHGVRAPILEIVYGKLKIYETIRENGRAQ